MEQPAFNFDDFKKWSQNKPIVVESDMEEFIMAEAKDFVITGIENASSATGLNIE